MLSPPIINGQSTAATRPAFLHELRRAGVDRVFLCPGNPFGDEVRLKAEMALLTENINSVFKGYSAEIDRFAEFQSIIKLLKKADKVNIFRSCQRSLSS